jgi:two-component system, OmpR family, KDP operon response regulator KdpE
MPRDRPSSTLAKTPAQAELEKAARSDHRPLLVVADDDPGLRLLLKRTLSAVGYEVRLVASIQDLLAAVNADKPEGLLLSTSLVGDQTPALLRSLRKRSSAFVVTLSSENRSDISDQETDYDIAVPFRQDELVLRVQNAHRRARLRQRKPVAIIHHGLLIDLTLNQVSMNGRPVPLSRLEFEVLRSLAEHEGKVVGYDQIMSESWRDPQSRTINRVRHVVHMLRLKLGCDDQGRSFIITDGRIGYRLRKNNGQ